MLRTMLFLAVVGCGALGAGAARADEPFYAGKRLTLLINFAPGGPTDVEGRLLAKHIAKHIDGDPLIVVQNKDGASGMVGSAYLGEVGPKDGTMFGYLTGTSWAYVIDPGAFRVDFRSLRLHRRAAGQRRLLHARRHAARNEGAGRPDESAGPRRRRAGRGFLEGFARAPDLRHARPAIPLRHRLSQQQHRAARLAERRDQRAFGIDAGLFRRRRAEPGEDRQGDAALVRPDQRRPAPQRRVDRWRNKTSPPSPSSTSR